MADFVAILSKTIDGLGDRNTAEMRQRVYERARKAIADKLAAINPPPSKAQADRQYKLLDEAVIELEKRHAPPAPTKPAASSDPLADFLASVDETLPVPVAAPAPKAVDAFRQGKLPAFPGATTKIEPGPVPFAPEKPVAMSAANEGTSRPDPVVGLDETYSLNVPPPLPKRVPAESSGGGAKGAIFALLGLLLIGGAGYAGYVYKDKFLGNNAGSTASSPAPAVKDTTASQKPADGTDAPQATDNKEQQTAAANQAQPKMTQRLTPEGQEIDAGPGTAAQDVGEGATVASATTPSGQTPPASNTDNPAVQPAVAVGEKAIFYEEKTGTESGTADQGSIVWSVVQDSPGLDQPPEPAIRADLTIPDKGLGLRMTIKRNLDKSLPASHIIEMLFTTPPDFKGGGIDNVSRFSMKDTEQSPGNPLVGVPASFGDGFFLIALTDEKTAIDTNLQLLDRQDWIDIPVAYKSGRRALLSFEKGLAGDKVFKEVLKSWADMAGGTKPADQAAPAADGGNG